MLYGVTSYANLTLSRIRPSPSNNPFLGTSPSSAPSSNLSMFIIQEIKKLLLLLFYGACVLTRRVIHKSTKLAKVDFFNFSKNFSFIKLVSEKEKREDCAPSLYKNTLKPDYLSPVLLGSLSP